ncbi:MAG: aldo/keto reductase [Thermoplasmata archaeon]|nr:aldo/keto reductase [Thermoplasmata archaeon]
MEARTITGVSQPLSVIGYRWSSPMSAAPGALRDRQATLTRAYVAGVRFFETASAPNGPAAERELASALGERLGSVVIATGVPAEALEGAHPGEDSVAGPKMRESVTESKKRLGVAAVDILLLTAPEGFVWQDPGVRRTIAELLRSKEIGCFGAIWPARDPSPKAVDAAISSGAALIGAPMGLLDNGTIDRLARQADGTPARLLAYDPFAGGRLDGSLFHDSPLQRGGPPGPQDLADLSERFKPVLQLGFLTDGKRRSLSQAALQFTLSRPMVASALIEGRHPKTLEEAGALERIPGLTVEELCRCDELRRLRLGAEESDTAVRGPSLR